AFGLRMTGTGAAERRRIADDWLARVRLADFADSYPHQLSGGMRQRVAIARAFATGSPVLLMDEPLGALDAQTRMLMQEELIALWEAERKTVLMVTHDIDEAIILSDRVIVMSGRPGTLREDITVPFDRPRSFEIERDPEYSALRARIWDLLREDARTATTADDREQRTLVAASAQRARDRRLATRDLVLSIATPILLLVLWELCARVEIIDPRFFPPPTRILAAGWEMLLDGELWQ